MELSPQGMAAEAQRLLEHPLLVSALNDWRNQATGALLEVTNLEALEGQQVVLDATRRLQLAEAFVGHLRLYAQSLDEAERQDQETE